MENQQSKASPFIIPQSPPQSPTLQQLNQQYAELNQLKMNIAMADEVGNMLIKFLGL